MAVSFKRARSRDTVTECRFVKQSVKSSDMWASFNFLCDCKKHRNKQQPKRKKEPFTQLYDLGIIVILCWLHGQGGTLLILMFTYFSCWYSFSSKECAWWVLPEWRFQHRSSSLLQISRYHHGLWSQGWSTPRKSRSHHIPWTFRGTSLLSGELEFNLSNVSFLR